MKKLIKQNLRFYSKFALLIGALIAFICSFGVSTYAWSVGSDGNLHSDNLISSDEVYYEVGAIYNQPGVSYSGNKVSLNTRLRIKNLFQLDSSLTYNVSVASGFDVNIQAYNDNGYQSNQSSSPFNTWAQNWTFTGYNYYAFAFRKNDNSTISLSDLSNIKIMLVVGSSVAEYEPYGDVYYSQDNYDNAVYNVLGGLDSYDAINLYYSSSITFVSTDGGNTYVNANNQDVSNTLVTNSDGSRSLLINKDNPWGYLNYYYVHVDFSYPVFLWRLRILNSLKPTDFIKVVVGDREITTFDYKPNIDGFSYIVSSDIYQQTNSVDFYFRINGYTSEGNRSFVLGYDGYNVGVDSYRQGYQKAKDDLQPIIDGLNENINILKAQVQNLTLQLQQGNSSWYSLFFAMADTPFKTASNFLGFEIFGVNLFNALIGFITILAIFWVFKRLIK